MRGVNTFATLNMLPVSTVGIVLALFSGLSAALDTTKVQKFAVDGARFPGFDFDLGTSYAGNLPTSTSNSSYTYNNETEDSLFFWYFPSNNTKASNETLIWFSGGPGCSSLISLLQENGPVTWAAGVPNPSLNPWGWQLLTNVIWVEYPAGVGFSQGPQLAKDEDEAAEQFLGFWKNFVDLFDVHNDDVYITGESYAGLYVPYVASHMLDRNDTEYYNLQGTLMYDAVLSNPNDLQDALAADFISKTSELLGFDDEDVKKYQDKADACGFTKYMEDSLQYPPKNKPSAVPKWPKDCGLWDQAAAEATKMNPCFDVYDVRNRCPYLTSPISTPDGAHVPDGQPEFFNRDDVKTALHVPTSIQWKTCTSPNKVFVGGHDLTDAAGKFAPQTVLPGVIERSKRTIIAHGDLDYILIKSGTLIAIQNMTWGGQQGYTAAPSDPFVVPSSNATSRQNTGVGKMGVTRTERGLTFCSLKLSGHTVPGFQPGGVFRHVEYLLGRVESLSSKEGFTV